MSFEYVAMEDVALEGALLVTGMPAVGMEATVAATFLAQQLRMRIIGSFQSLELPPVGAVRNGVATSPIQVWAAELECGPDGRCDRLLVLKSDLPIPMALQMGLASAVTTWARERGIAMIIGMDTYAVKPGGGQAKQGVLVATSLRARDVAARLGGKALEESLITGFTAGVLMRANRERLVAVGLYAPSSVPEAEVEGTTALIEMARPLIPKLEVETAELAKLVEEQALVMRKEREKQAEEARRMRDLVDRGYL